MGLTLYSIEISCISKVEATDPFIYNDILFQSFPSEAVSGYNVATCQRSKLESLLWSSRGVKSSAPPQLAVEKLWSSPMAKLPEVIAVSPSTPYLMVREDASPLYVI